jgi:hypothetical protein
VQVRGNLWVLVFIYHKNTTLALAVCNFVIAPSVLQGPLPWLVTNKCHTAVFPVSFLWVTKLEYFPVLIPWHISITEVRFIFLIAIQRLDIQNLCLLKGIRLTCYMCHAIANNDDNLIQFNLFTCKLNSPEANYKASTSREKKRTYTNKIQKEGNNNNNNNSINTNKSEK